MTGDGEGNGGFSQIEGGFRGEEILGIGDVEPAWNSGRIMYEDEGVTGTGEADVEESQVFGDGGGLGLDASGRCLEVVEGPYTRERSCSRYAVSWAARSSRFGRLLRFLPS